jgi:hypothetical protein
MTLRERIKAKEDSQPPDNSKYKNSHQVIREYIKYLDVLEALKEAYKSPNFEWIEKFVNELYTNPGNSDEICNKYKVELGLGGSDKNNKVTHAKYNDISDNYTFYISDEAFEDIDYNKNKDEFITELMEFVAHEDTHKQQNQLDSYKRDYFTPSDYDDLEQVDKHLSQQVEIDANGRGVAYEAGQKISYKDSKDLLNKIIAGKKKDIDLLSKKSYVILNHYRRIGGKIWRRFLKQFYSYYNYHKYGGLAEYNKWLADHK